MAVDNLRLERWRLMDASICLAALAEHAKEDPSFNPRSSTQTTRWHAYVGGHDVELLCNGPKFWDTRDKCGGGGAIDLVMHLFKMNFKRAVELLSVRDI